MSEEQQQARGRKPATPNIDRVLESIGRGDYDDRLTDLSNLVAERNKVLQARVMEEVRRVYGPDAHVVTTKAPPIFSNLGGNSATAKEVAQRESLAEANPTNPFLEKSRGEESETSDPDNAGGAAGNSDPLAHLDETERQMEQEPQGHMPGRSGAVISGLSPSDMGD